MEELTSIKNVSYQGQNQVLIHTQAPSLPVSGKWSFCKVRRTFRSEDFQYREPGTVKAVNAWEEAIWKRKKWISFEDWADEYEWKHPPDY